MKYFLIPGFVSIIALILFLSIGWCVLPNHAVSACGAVRGIDQWGTALFPIPLAPALLTTFIFFTSLADPRSVSLFIAVALLALVLIRERRLAAVFFGALLIGDSIVLAAKDFFNRVRPPDLLYAFNRIGASYPSAHAFIAVVFYGFTAYVLLHHLHVQKYTYRRSVQLLIAVLTFLLIIAISLSRVALDFHWLSDVIGGWLLGIAVLVPLIATYRVLHKKT